MPASQMVVVDPEAVAGDSEGELEVDLQAVVRKVEEAVVVRIVELQVEKSLEFHLDLELKPTTDLLRSSNLFPFPPPPKKKKTRAP